LLNNQAHKPSRGAFPTYTESDRVQLKVRLSQP